MSQHHEQSTTIASVLLLSLILALMTVGCPQPIQVDERDLLADAAVAPLPPRAVCKHEPLEIGQMPDGGGELLAEFVRTRDSTLLVRVSGADKGPAKLTIDRIGPDGAPATTGETALENPEQLIGLDAVSGGENIVVALSSSEGRVDVLTLTPDGKAAAPPRSIQVAKGSRASVMWFKSSPLILAAGALIQPDPPAVDRSETSGTEADGGATEGDGGSGADPGLPSLPSGVTEIVVSGEDFGWIRNDDKAVFLEHRSAKTGETLTTEVAPRDHGNVSLLWAGDRYIVGDSDGPDIARYVISRHGGAKAKGPLLRLGGRMSLPRPDQSVIATAWSNAGPRHVGVAQLLSRRHLRFTNVALNGLVLDAAVHITPERDIVGARVTWDGRGYVLLWAEKVDQHRLQAFLTRFSCPDD